MREKISYKQRLNQHRNSNSRTTRLQRISGKKAIERLKETKKRNSKNVVSRDAQNHWSTVREKTAADCEIRQQELRAKQQEHKSQQQMMKAIILQQQQMNKGFLNVVEKLLNK